jgi:hypothetical protein
MHRCSSLDINLLAVLESNTTSSNTFGFAVSTSGDAIVVGDHLDDNSGSDSGAAYVFVRDGTSWTQQAYLKASNAGEDDYFGYSVSISGDTIVVGAYQEDSNATGVDGTQNNDPYTSFDSGAAYVFVRDGTMWTQQAYLKASNIGKQYSFGWSVSISGNTIVVGAPKENAGATGSGAAYVFVRDGTSWTQQTHLKASNAGISDAFGISVGI